VTLFLTALVAGIGVGSIYGLLAMSYTVVYNSTGIFNVAQGDLMMCGVLASYYALDVWHVPQVVTLLFVVSVVIFIGLVEERIAVRPFLTRTGAEGFGWFISTLGFSLILETGAFVLYGQNAVAPIPSVTGAQSFRIGSLYFSPQYLLVFVVMIVLTILLVAFYRYTWLGLAMQAISEDSESSALRGVDVRWISRAAFVLAGLVTGIAAYVIAPIVSANVTIGLTYGLKAFIALAVGGFGSIRGCVVGGILLGVSEQMFDLYVNPNFEVLAGLILILIVLSTRPSGIFSTNIAREV
jgi:branched-chain amino acid transport system permease protein